MMLNQSSSMARRSHGLKQLTLEEALRGRRSQPGNSRESDSDSDDDSSSDFSEPDPDSSDEWIPPGSGTNSRASSPLSRRSPSPRPARRHGDDPAPSSRSQHPPTSSRGGRHARHPSLALMRATKTKKKDPVPTTRIQNPSTSIRGRHAPSSALMRRTKTKKKDTASSTLIQHPSTSSSQSSNFHAPRTTKAKKKDQADILAKAPTLGPGMKMAGSPAIFHSLLLRSAAAELDSDQPADFLKLFLTDELLQNIVEQTNLYASQRNRGEPANMREVANLEVGGRTVRHNGRVMVVAWQDKRLVVKAWTVRRRLGEDEVEQTEGEGGGAEGDVDVEGRPNRAPYNTDPDSRLPH
ncbi:serine/arginine repetitive matrix protein 1-like [Engraulis encrasicolus]|uniref:serine/arginine repetitive matrix protein 1-like n=1 Tax=Engraulis encrasicolus TaxID=184585 RepID=UPI002FD2C841